MIFLSGFFCKSDTDHTGWAVYITEWMLLNTHFLEVHLYHIFSSQKGRETSVLLAEEAKWRAVNPEPAVTNTQLRGGCVWGRWSRTPQGTGMLARAFLLLLPYSRRTSYFWCFWGWKFMFLTVMMSFVHLIWGHTHMISRINLRCGHSGQLTKSSSSQLEPLQ